MQKFKIIGKPLLGEKYVEGKKEEEEGRKEEGIMPSLVATISALARTTYVRMHYVRTNMRAPRGVFSYPYARTLPAVHPGMTIWGVKGRQKIFANICAYLIFHLNFMS